MRVAHRGFAFAALSALVLLSACGDDNEDGGGTAQDLSGTYTLAVPDGLQVTFIGDSPTAVAATGIAMLTPSTYSITIESADPIYGPQFAGTRTGTYTATGTTSSGTWTQEEDGTGTQLVGTYTFDSATGTLTLTTDVPNVAQVRLQLIED
jgi:hypothetical protein